MKARVLKNHIVLIGSVVILTGCDLADDSRKRAQIDCLNHLKLLGVSVVMDAQDHEDTIPSDFLFLTNHGISPSILICPIDPARKGRTFSAPEQQLSPAQCQATNISYQLVTSGAKLASSNYQVLVRCPFHQQASFAEGSRISVKSEASK